MRCLICVRFTRQITLGSCTILHWLTDVHVPANVSLRCRCICRLTCSAYIHILFTLQGKPICVPSNKLHLKTSHFKRSCCRTKPQVAVHRFPTRLIDRVLARSSTPDDCSVDSVKLTALTGRAYAITQMRNRNCVYLHEAQDQSTCSVIHLACPVSPALIPQMRNRKCVNAFASTLSSYWDLLHHPSLLLFWRT
jgi:hypothetical protein